MQFINPIYLYTSNNEEHVDEFGNATIEKTRRKVFADVSSIRQNEFYQAQASGFKPEVALIIRSFEYRGEDVVEFNNKLYNVVRTFDKGDRTIEIICTGVVNDGNSKSD